MPPNRRDAIGTLLAAPAALLSAAAQAASPVAAGSKLTLVDLPLIEGGVFRAADAERKVLAVYWWASWCPFCAEMSPSVEQLWRSQRDRGLAVLGISIDRTPEAARDHRARRGYTFPSAIHHPGIDAVFAKPKTIPAFWVRDRTGRVVMAETGQLFPEDIAQVARFL